MKKFAVIGLGNFGFHAARSLYEDGNEVVAIDTDRERVQMADAHATEAIVLDATTKQELRALGLDQMDGVLVSTGAEIGNSILICLYLQEIGVKRILAKAQDDDHAEILKRVGATEIINPEREVAGRVARSLSHPNLLDFIPLAEGFEIAQISPPEKFIGKSLKELNLRANENLHVIAIKEPESQRIRLVPSADYVIQAQHTLVVLGRVGDLDKIKP